MKRSSVKRNKVLVVVGPTASGKTALGILLAKKFNGEIISADSRQIYKGLNIGTGKITQREAAGIPHHLLSITSLKHPYSLARYQKEAVKTIEKIIHKRKLPIIVGGTGLYVDAITENFVLAKAPPQKALRKILEAELDKFGLSHLLQKLKHLDSKAFREIDKKNPRRVLRALEAALQGETISRKKAEPKFEFFILGIITSKEVLRRRIDKRVSEMARKGLIAETKKLVKEYGKNKILLQTIGYKEAIDYFDKKISLEEAYELIKRNTRHYAKRQMTWFNKNKDIVWVKNKKTAIGAVRAFLK